MLPCITIGMEEEVFSEDTGHGMMPAWQLLALKIEESAWLLVIDPLPTLSSL